MDATTLSPLAPTLAPDVGVLAVPALQAGSPTEMALQPVHQVIRHGKAVLYETYLSAVASRAHPLQDAAAVLALHDGWTVCAVTDAATNAVGVHPQDATFVVGQALLELVQTTQAKARHSWPTGLLRHLQAVLRKWLKQAHSRAVCGVAQAVAVVGPKGELIVASIGDVRVLVYRPGNWWKRPQLLHLTPPPATSEDGRKLRSALGQSEARPLSIDLNRTTLGKGELLLMGSDGGFPTAGMADLELGLRGYYAEKKVGLGNLARLGGVLDAQAMRHLHYDDDRSLLLLERL
jgi:hypothetical protein